MRVLDEVASGRFHQVESIARNVLTAYGYAEFRTPILEHTELFVRSVGQSTDIVGKEMYTFEDRGGRSLTLRPEGTAPVVRAVIERGIRNTPMPLKLFYIGPYFRYERPQKGRYRQFHQIGAELLGDARPEADVEVIQMLVELLGACGFSGLTVALQTLGDDESRDRFRATLVEYLTPQHERLSPESQERLESNPLRILDSKVRGDREILADAPRIDGSLTEEARKHFERVQQLLDLVGVSYRLDSSLVRGLDYYTGTVFEISSDELGAQDALVGGGRYDNLVAELGGTSTPAIGFAIGLDRVVEAMPETQAQDRPRAVVLPLHHEALATALRTAAVLRDAGISTDVGDADRGIGKALQVADRRGIRWAVLIGEDELAAEEWSLKDLISGDQQRVGTVQELASTIQQETD